MLSAASLSGYSSNSLSLGLDGSLMPSVRVSNAMPPRMTACSDSARALKPAPPVLISTPEAFQKRVSGRTIASCGPRTKTFTATLCASVARVDPSISPTETPR